MNRREVISRLGLLVGGTIIGAEAFLTGCSPQKKPTGPALSSDQIHLLNEVAETIIPKTPESDGAKAANVGEFMNTIVSDFYNAEEQKIFLDGISSLKRVSFDQLSESERVSFVMDLENQSKSSDDHYYLMIKQLTIWGYMTSETGMNQMFDFAPVPGRFDACIEYVPGDKVMNPRISQGAAQGYATFHSRSST